MDSPTRPVLSPTKVLHPVSPERMNQQTIPASPSLPTDLLSLHHKNTRGVSEVQAKVAFLNNLSRQASPAAQAQSAAQNAALQRAILGREEAESTLESVQEELSEAQSRERRISERLESLMEELHGAKERQAHERSIFEKEIRKARKEAFRAGSTLVRLQEELKHAKSEAKALKDEVAAERESKDIAKQEAFERAYALAGLTEELEVLKGKLRSMEASNHSNTLQVRAHEIRKEDFGRLSLAEGDLAFLTTPRRPKRAAAGSVKSPAPELESLDVEATPPKRLRLSECTTTAGDDQVTPENESSESYNEAIEELQDELELERRRRSEAEEMVHFMNIECQFERCSCRIAETQGRRYIYDEDYYEKFQKAQLEAEAAAAAEAAAKAETDAQAQAQSTPSPFIAMSNPATRPALSPPTPTHHHIQHTPVRQQPELPTKTIKTEPTDPPEKMPMPAEPLVTFSPETGTFTTYPSPLRDNVKARRTDSFASPGIRHSNAHSNSHRDWRNSAMSAASSIHQVESHTPTAEPVPSRMIHIAPSEPAAVEPVPAPEPMDVRPSRRQEREEYQPHQSMTKRIPLREATESQGSSGLVHDTPINREEALAQIRARRSRARSKQRSVSANEATGRSAGSTGSVKSTPGRTAKRVPNLRADSRGENDVNERRDLSAPVRMFRR
ncbi:hypothetical protein N7509_011711 [Penicillium cosmopolitanum]|uniref:Uncharacterized protein n=1 Tax=Penicillium cosmopolitanum TaxID=1131564 RepID=A0A9W9SH95_9EURO|nr:uncharacterized protein N7509_011711 [Penicillium cosmopolitanum]KAJ5378592.1 hypothetical protein N7509_011711 [Penicillium cosmopolitanum]